MNRAIVFASAILLGCGGAFAPIEDAGKSDASADVAQVLDDAAIEPTANDASTEDADASDASASDAPSSIVCVIDGTAYACEAVDWVWYSTPIETSPCNVGVCPVGRGCYFPKPGGEPSSDIGSCRSQ